MGFFFGEGECNYEPSTLAQFAHQHPVITFSITVLITLICGYWIIRLGRANKKDETFGEKK